MKITFTFSTFICKSSWLFHFLYFTCHRIIMRLLFYCLNSLMFNTAFKSWLLWFCWLYLWLKILFWTSHSWCTRLQLRLRWFYTWFRFNIFQIWLLNTWLLNHFWLSYWTCSVIITQCFTLFKLLSWLELSFTFLTCIYNRNSPLKKFSPKKSFDFFHSLNSLHIFSQLNFFLNLFSLLFTDFRLKLSNKIWKLRCW